MTQRQGEIDVAKVPYPDTCFESFEIQTELRNLQQVDVKEE